MTSMFSYDDYGEDPFGVQNQVECDGCGALFFKDQLTTINGERLCDECLRSNEEDY